MTLNKLASDSRLLMAFATAAAVGLVAAAPMTPQIPARPEQLQFPPLKFEPPNAADYRHTLPSGVAVYLAPSREFPLIDVLFTFKGGAYLDPAEKVGLAQATGTMMRRGGTTSVSASEMDEQFDFLAANAAAAAGSSESLASLNCLKSNFDEAFGLFMQMLRTPGFDAARLAIYKDEVTEAMKQRNDRPQGIAAREWGRLLYGPDHYQSREPTKAMIDSISADDLRAMHQRIFHPAPGNLIIAVSGDFDEKTILAKLEAALAGWPPRPVNPDPPAPALVLAPGLYHVEKDIPQGRVTIGMRGIKRDDPDYFPLLLMNDILGGGGFTSRITNRVRSDEGLAYSAGSALVPGVYFPGEFRASFESKSPTVALATTIVYDEIDAIRDQPVTDQELEISKKSFIERFPRTFESKPTMLRVFVSDEMTRREANYWKTYRDKISAVTPQDIQRVAQTRLKPEQLAILIVGKWSDMEPGDPAGRANMKGFFDGRVTRLPLRDPLTLQPMP